MNLKPSRCVTAPRVAAAIRAVEPALAGTSPLHVADLAAILGQIRGRTIRLTDMSLLGLPARPMVTAAWTRAPSRDYLFHDDRIAGTHYHRDVVLHMLSHIYLGHEEQLRVGADTALGGLFDAEGRAMLCPAGVLASADISVAADTVAEADADAFAFWLSSSTESPGDAERRRLTMSQLHVLDTHLARRPESGKRLQMVISIPETGCAR